MLGMFVNVQLILVFVLPCRFICISVFLTWLFCHIFYYLWVIVSSFSRIVANAILRCYQKLNEISLFNCRYFGLRFSQS